MWVSKCEEQAKENDGETEYVVGLALNVHVGQSQSVNKMLFLQLLENERD